MLSPHLGGGLIGGLIGGRMDLGTIRAELKQMKKTFFKLRIDYKYRPLNKRKKGGLRSPFFLPS
jgi:hypothetical protein